MTRPPGPAASRRGEWKDELGDETVRRQEMALKRWSRFCAASGADPEHPTGPSVREFIASRAHLRPGTLLNDISALKRRAREQRRDDPALWRPAEEFVRARRHADRLPGSRRLTPRPRQQEPLLRDDAARLAAAPGRGGSYDHPDRTARGRAALLALRAGTPLEQLAWALRPGPAAALGHGPLRLDVPARGGNRPAARIELSDSPAGPGLPSPAGAARDLLRRLPDGARHVWANTSSACQPHGVPLSPAAPSRTISSVHAQLAAAARRAGLPWPASQRDAAAAAAALTPDEARLLHDLLDPAALRRVRDHAERTITQATALRAIDVHALDRPQAVRHSPPGADARWTITVPRTKNSGRRTFPLKPTGDPRTCPVAALDRLTALLDATGHHDGPLTPALDSGGAFTANRHSREHANAALAHDAAAVGADKRHTTRSHRTGRATQLVRDGHPLSAVEELTGNNTRNAGRYVRDIPPHVLRF